MNDDDELRMLEERRTAGFEVVFAADRVVHVEYGRHLRERRAAQEEES